MESQEQLNDRGNEAGEESVYSVPWEPIDNWVGLFLLALINAALLILAYQGYRAQVAQSAALILLQLIYLVPVIVVFAYRRIHPGAIGFGKFKWSMLGLGCGLLVVGYLIIFIHNMILFFLGIETQGQEMLGFFTGFDSPVWLILVGTVFAPVVEEVFFRGFLFQGFRQRYGWIPGLILSSLFFAAAHMSLVVLIPTFIFGAILAYVYHRTNSVWPGILLHFLVNAFGFCSIYVATQLADFIPA